MAGGRGDVVYEDRRRRVLETGSPICCLRKQMMHLRGHARATREIGAD